MQLPRPAQLCFCCRRKMSLEKCMHKCNESIYIQIALCRLLAKVIRMQMASVETSQSLREKADVDVTDERRPKTHSNRAETFSRDFLESLCWNGEKICRNDNSHMIAERHRPTIANHKVPEMTREPQHNEHHESPRDFIKASRLHAEMLIR